MLAASTVILGIDRPVRLPARRRVPGHPLGSGAALLVTLAAIALTLGVTTYGLMTDRREVALIAVLASITIAVAMVIRARDSLRSAERSSELLDSALDRIGAQESRTRRRQRPTADRRTPSLQTIHLAVAQGFNLIDERTQGRLRELIEQTGDDLAALVDERIEE